MSDTPRTDAADDSKLYALSQQLERELKMAKDVIIDELRQRQIHQDRFEALSKDMCILQASMAYQYGASAAPTPDTRWRLMADRLATQLYSKPEDSKTPEHRIVLDMYSQLAGEPNEP